MPSDGDVKRKQKLRYEFAPLPAAAIAAVGAGELSYPDLAILAFLYLRRNYESMQAIVYLDQLAEAIRWTLTLDALQKRLRRLRSRGWIAYAIPPGRNRPRYEIALFPKPTRSEASPSVSEVIDPSRQSFRDAALSEITPKAMLDRSVATRSDRGHEGPSQAQERLSRKHTPSADRNSDSAKLSVASVRTPQKDQIQEGYNDGKDLLKREPSRARSEVMTGGGACDDCGVNQRELHVLGVVRVCPRCFEKRQRAASTLSSVTPTSSSPGNPPLPEKRSVGDAKDTELLSLEGADRFVLQLRDHGLSLDEISDATTLSREVVQRLITGLGS